MSKEALDIDFDSLFGQGVEYEVGGSPGEGSTPENVGGNISQIGRASCRERV